MILTTLFLMAVGGEPIRSNDLPGDPQRWERRYAEREREAGPLEDFRGGGSTDASGLEAAAYLAVMGAVVVVGLLVLGIAALVKAAS